MKRRAPLRRSSSLSSSGRLRRVTPIAPVSAKRAVLNRQRRLFVAEVLEARPFCEARERLLVEDRSHLCRVVSCDVHEIVTRARGGSIVDPCNVLALCRACHDWVHGHPAAATRLGLLASSNTTRLD